MARQDIFDKQWPDIHTQAVLSRVQAVKLEDDNTKVLSKDLFDDLVKIVEVVNRVNVLPHGVDQIVVETSLNGYQVQVKDNLTPDSTAEGRTVIEAILNGLRKKEMQVASLIQ